MAHVARPLSNSENAYLRNLVVVEMLITDLLPLNRRARRHRRKQIQQIARSIETFGFLNPVLIDGDNYVIAGFGRVLAAEMLGMLCVPTILISGMTEAQLHAYAIADNKLAENAEWDNEILAIEFQYIHELDIDLDLTITGFETPEIDLIIGEAALEDPEPPIPPLIGEAATSRIGDLWVLNEHRLFCGDARQRRSYQALLAGQLAEMIITDPPYNQRIASLVGKGATQHREFPMASGEMSKGLFCEFLNDVMELCIAFSADGSLHFLFMDWRGIGVLLAGGERIYTELKNVCVWDKGRGGMGSLYRSQHELVAIFKNGKASHINNMQLGKYGRNRTNVWHYSPAKLGGEADLRLHPTAKPVSMVADAILDCSNRRCVILDPFGGSGTTLLAAERTGRCGYLIELDPLYVDLIVRRWQQMIGGTAVHEETGLSFDHMTTQRMSEAQSQEVCHGGR